MVDRTSGRASLHLPKGTMPCALELGGTARSVDAIRDERAGFCNCSCCVCRYYAWQKVGLIAVPVAVAGALAAVVLVTVIVVDALGNVVDAQWGNSSRIGIDTHEERDRCESISLKQETWELGHCLNVMNGVSCRFTPGVITGIKTERQYLTVFQCWPASAGVSREGAPSKASHPGAGRGYVTDGR